MLPEADSDLDQSILEHDNGQDPNRQQNQFADALSNPLDSDSLQLNTAVNMACSGSCSGLVAADKPHCAVSAVHETLAAVVSSSAAQPGPAAVAPTAALTSASSRLGLAKRKRVDPEDKLKVERLLSKGCWVRWRPATPADGGLLACSTW